MYQNKQEIELEFDQVIELAFPLLPANIIYIVHMCFLI